MRIDTSNNFQISINTGNNISTQNTNDTSKSGNVKSIYVGNLNQNNTTQNNIEQKKQQARKQAMKLMSDAWDKDKSRQGKVDDLNNTKSDTVQQISDLKERIKDIDNEKENKRLEYGVDKDSQEQKDLELLEKYQENRYGSANDKFSQEEVDRLKELQNTPLTLLILREDLRIMQCRMRCADFGRKQLHSPTRNLTVTVSSICAVFIVLGTVYLGSNPKK